MNPHVTAVVPLIALVGLVASSERPERPVNELSEPGPFRVGTAAACSATDTIDVGPDYYRIDLRPPASSFGGRDVVGRVEVAYPSSPFGLPLNRDGVLVQRLRIGIDADWRTHRGRLVAWVAPPDLDPVRKLGEIGRDGTVTGEVAMNKFLVFVTDEPPGAAEVSRWQGPVVLKGKSRSGRMQSMASHGMFEPEPC